MHTCGSVHTKREGDSPARARNTCAFMREHEHVYINVYSENRGIFRTVAFSIVLGYTCVIRGEHSTLNPVQVIQKCAAYTKKFICSERLLGHTCSPSSTPHSAYHSVQDPELIRRRRVFKLQPKRDSESAPGPHIMCVYACIHIHESNFRYIDINQISSILTTRAQHTCTRTRGVCMPECCRRVSHAGR